MATDLIDDDTKSSWLVCGWFTPDYEHWARQLAVSLDTVGAPYHLRAVDKSARSWEGETMRKPFMIKQALEQFPDRTIVFVDVDCRVLRPLHTVIENMRADVAAFVSAKRARRGKDGALIKVRSGAMLFSPTQGAKNFVDAWIKSGGECGPFDVDQTSLMIAMGRVVDSSFQFLPVECCATVGDRCENPFILHDHASRDKSKVPKLVGRMLGSWLSSDNKGRKLGGS